MAVLAGLTVPDFVGRLFITLFLIWSPYHYAAQAYRLALMYGARTGIRCTARERQWLWWICLLPFLRAVVNPTDTSVTDVMGVRGVLWVLPETLLRDGIVAESLTWLVTALIPLIFVLPLLFAFAGRTRLTPLGLVLLLVNGLWLVGFSYFEGAVWATVAHSIQYLLIVSFTHAHDATRPGSARHRHVTDMLAFYVLSVIAGVPLFMGLPVVVETIGGWIGQSWSASHCVTMTVVAINLHHFIVDGRIWRTTRSTIDGAHRDKRLFGA